MFGSGNFFLKGYDCFLECNFKSNQNKNAILILHPHPIHGGTMHNKVTFQIYKTFFSLSFDTLRYNSRGVGKSEGEFTNGEKEIFDAIELLKLLLKNYENVSIAGFSFGSYISWEAVHKISTEYKRKIQNIILIAPPTNLYEFCDYDCDSSVLLIQGEKDSIVPMHYTNKFASKLTKETHYHTIKNADHFFTNQLDELSTYIEKYINSEKVN